MTLDKSQNIIILLISLVLFSHLLHQPVITNILMVLTAIYAFTTPGFKSRFSTSIKTPHYWISISVFLIYAISLFYSENMKEGLRSISAKLPLFIFPTLFILLPIKEKAFRYILKLFPFFLLISLLISGSYQFLQYTNTGDLSLLYSDNLGALFGTQAVYNGLFINLALVIIFSIIAHIATPKIEKIGFGILGAFLFSFQFLLISRIAFLISILIIVFFLLKFVFSSLSLKKSILISSTLLLILSLGFISSSKLQKRFSSVFNTEFRYDNPNPINHFNAEQSDENWNSFTARLATWSCAVDVFKKSPIVGYGVGDHFDELQLAYKDKNYILGMKEQYNTHNQYLDISLACGIIGLLILIIFMLSPIIHGIKTRNWLLVSIFVVIALSALTENILNRSQGIVIVSVLVLLIYSFSTQRFNQKKESKL